jgi:hypothetical protein
VFPREAAEQDGDLLTLFSFEGTLHRLLEVLELDKAALATQARALGFKDGLNVSLIVEDSGTAFFHGMNPPEQNLSIVLP